MTIQFSVVTPVGAKEHHRKWLNECVNSVRAQTLKANEHILVGDGLDLSPMEGATILNLSRHVGVLCVNNGIEIARNDWIVILNSDDELMPRCLELLSNRIEEIQTVGHVDKFYLRFPVIVSDDKSSPAGQCFHKDVWKLVGGYPNTIAFDVYFVDKILRSQYPVYDITRTEDSREFYRYRDHPDTWTREHGGSVV